MVGPGARRRGAARHAGGRGPGHDAPCLPPHPNPSPTPPPPSHPKGDEYYEHTHSGLDVMVTRFMDIYDDLSRMNTSFADDKRWGRELGVGEGWGRGNKDPPCPCPFSPCPVCPTPTPPPAPPLNPPTPQPPNPPTPTPSLLTLHPHPKVPVRRRLRVQQRHGPGPAPRYHAVRGHHDRRVRLLPPAARRAAGRDACAVRGLRPARHPVGWGLGGGGGVHVALLVATLALFAAYALLVIRWGNGGVGGAVGAAGVRGAGLGESSRGWRRSLPRGGRPAAAGSWAAACPHALALGPARARPDHTMLPLTPVTHPGPHPPHQALPAPAAP
jgi:hypothetical protein